MKNNFILILVIIGVLFLLFYIKRKFKVPKVGAICMVNGGVKTGKTTFLVFTAIKHYKRVLRRVKIRNFFLRIFKRKELELPLLYSNIPLAGIEYVPLTTDLLTHKKRFAYRSVVILSEFSLVADSTFIKDKILNNELLMFCKLFGHETKGGYCFVDSQCIADCHYAIKRVLSEYFYIHSIIRWLPFFIICRVREDRYSEDGSVLSVNTEDVELKLRNVIITKRTWKRFDSYCYSVLFDNLPVEDNVTFNDYKDDLKARDIITFNPLVKDYVNHIGESNDKA